MDEKLMAEYGQATLRFEIEQARYNDIKKRVVEAYNKSVTPVPEVKEEK